MGDFEGARPLKPATSFFTATQLVMHSIMYGTSSLLVYFEYITIIAIYTMITKQKCDYGSKLQPIFISGILISKNNLLSFCCKGYGNYDLRTFTIPDLSKYQQKRLYQNTHLHSAQYSALGFITCKLIMPTVRGNLFPC